MNYIVLKKCNRDNTVTYLTVPASAVSLLSTPLIKSKYVLVRFAAAWIEIAIVIACANSGDSKGCLITAQEI